MKILKRIINILYSPFRVDGGGDFKAMLFCLLAALIFWFFNSMNRNHSANITYPIRFEYKDSSLVEISPLPKKISLLVTGYGWNILRKTFWFNIDPIIYKIENPLKVKVLSAKTLFPIVSEKLKGLTVNSILKDTIWINFERKINKEQLLFVDTSKVTLADGLKIISPIEIEPLKVMVEGPESIVSKLNDTLFLTIPQNKIDEDYDSEVKLFEVSDLINLNTQNARVKFKVGNPPPLPYIITAEDSIKNIQRRQDSLKRK